MSKLYFKISELVHSDKAILYRINNMPDINSLDNLLNLIYYVLNPLRERLGKPITITSGYRCKKLNEIVGGVSNSQHTTGEAADFIIEGMKVKDIIEFIKNTNIEYDQLINEYDKWVHISYRKGKNRQQYIIYK